MVRADGITVDSAAFKRDIVRFSRRYGVSLDKVMRGEMKPLCADLLRRFPPSKKMFSSGDLARLEARSDKGLGKRAIEKDLNRIAFVMDNPAALRFFADRFGRTFEADGVIFDPAGTRMREVHRKWRSSRTGRVTKAGSYTRDVGRWKFPDKVHVTKRGFRRYLREVQKSVGKLKGGWAAGVTRNGGKVPAWINKFSGGGSAGGRIDQKGNGTLWAANNVPYASRFTRILKYSLSLRKKKFKRAIVKAIEKEVRAENMR